jgi:hypothetical protein
MGPGPVRPVEDRWRTVVTLVVLAASVVLAGCGSSTSTTPTPGATTGGAAQRSEPNPGARAGSAAPSTLVMVIRHGEKPDGSDPGVDAAGNEDDSSLTEVGWNRAHRLVDLFDPAQGAPRPGLARPEVIYAAGATDDGEGQRTRETVEPLADTLGIEVISTRSA